MPATPPPGPAPESQLSTQLDAEERTELEYLRRRVAELEEMARVPPCAAAPDTSPNASPKKEEGGSANARKRFSLARSVTLFPAAVREPTSLAVHDNFQASDAAASVPASSPPRPRLGTIGGGEAICMSGKL